MSPIPNVNMQTLTCRRHISTLRSYLHLLSFLGECILGQVPHGAASDVLFYAILLACQALILLER